MRPVSCNRSLGRRHRMKDIWMKSKSTVVMASRRLYASASIDLSTVLHIVTLTGPCYRPLHQPSTYTPRPVANPTTSISQIFPGSTRPNLHRAAPYHRPPHSRHVPPVGRRGSDEDALRVASDSPAVSVDPVWSICCPSAIARRSSASSPPQASFSSGGP